jgi:hypothetical protein
MLAFAGLMTGSGGGGVDGGNVVVCLQWGHSTDCPANSDGYSMWAFTMLARRLEVRGFWHGRVAFNHTAPCAVKPAGIADGIRAGSSIIR